MARCDAPLRLYLLRHGESAANAAKRFGGRDDSALTALGHRQSHAASERLAAVPLHAAYTSPASRARSLAELICAGRPFAPVVWESLHETSFGRWEGRTFAEIAAADPEACRHWMEHPLSGTPPGGESFQDCMARVRHLPAAIQDLAGPGAGIAVITHGGTLRALLASLTQSEPSLALHLSFANASISVVDLYGEDAVIRLLNDTSHLTGLTT